MPKISTQQFLEIKQVREGVMVLKDKSLRGVLMVSSLNFALKSEEEQNAIIYQFQEFLNSLDFSIQILVQTRRLNITGYLDKLEGLERKQDNELLKIQTKGYREFIAGLIKGETIMTKTFFVVVPYHLSPVEMQKFGKAQKFTPKKQGQDLKEDVFQRYKGQLWQRMEFVALGLRRCGLQAIPLITPELIELFWKFHHPKEAEFGYYPEIPPELAQ
jgi:type IV secretory pathway VirB4 component